MAAIARADTETDMTASPIWRPRSQADLAPPGVKAKARANLAALGVLRRLQANGAAPTPADAALMGRWAGWGACPEIFDDSRDEWEAERLELRSLLSPEEWAAARRTVLNAHYTSADVVSAVWKAVVDLGFTGGRVLEPGCGSGNFIGLAPDLPLELVGVELDPVTAAIAQVLYPHADIRAQGFEDTTFAPEYFDLVVGNVPFAKLPVHDPVYNKAHHSIHNYFILKAMEFLRPGALMAVLTSRYTMDSRNAKARREMAERADLIGAVRLPEGAFMAAAGTQATIDILLLRKRTNGASLWTTPWSSLVSVPTEGRTPSVEISEYFAANPDHMLGDLVSGRGMYTDGEPVVKARKDQPLADQLEAVLADIVAKGLSADLAWLPPSRPTLKVVSRQTRRETRVSPGPSSVPAPQAPADNVVIPAPPRKEGTILTVDGRFGIVRYGVIEPYEANPRSDTAELRHLVRLRDIIAALLEAQATSDDDSKFLMYQTALNLAYDEYVAKYGAISRFKLVRTGRTDAEGEDKTRRMRPRMGGFRVKDPDFPSLLALEIFDPESQTAAKAPIFTTRVVAPRAHRRTAATARDALSICLDEHGDVRLAEIAKLLDVEPGKAREMLGDLVWDDPDTGELQTASKYLSGNIRTKLAAARVAALNDPHYEAHVAALEAILPTDLDPTEINAGLGATWIDKRHIEDFIREALMEVKPAEAKKHPVIVSHVPVTATWAVYVDSMDRHSVALSSTWGTGRCDAAHLVEFSLNQSPAVVYDTWVENGKRKQIKNVSETLAALEKQEAISDLFSEWVWRDPTRAAELVRIYNDRFNSTVLPAYDGSHLTLPGLAAHITPHPHQLDSIWRTISDPTIGLFHPVGAGKTLVMAASAMEMRRLGLVNKPVIEVPNHMLEQFAAEMIQLFPRARVLIATKEQTDKAHRKEFIARCAMGEWDAIIITTSSFERIPVSPGTRAKFLAEKMEELEKAIGEQKEADGERVSIKRMENALAKLEERHEKLLAEHRKDDGINFESSGIDYLFMDEAHLYKNMAFPTRIQSAGGAGSQRAEDLEVKIMYLRSRHGERVCTLSTATPVANSLAEIFVMQRYLQPGALRAAGIYEFDAWAATFGRTVNQLELAPDGSTYRIGTRFARFKNVPDLMAMFRLVADVRTPDELKLPIPDLVGGAAETVVVPPSPALTTFMRLLAERAEAVRNREVTPDVDNMLTVSNDGRKAALHMNLVLDKWAERHEEQMLEVLELSRMASTVDKVQRAAKDIAAEYFRRKDDRFRDPAGNVSARPGACQLVFCDLGTPKEGRWSVYEELRGHLHKLGLPLGSVRFIHEAGDDRAKAELFAACRDGRVAVLIASTAKGGIGTNIQERLVALHHLDCPWRPCDIEQREGRILRQGNHYSFLEPELREGFGVRILRYVTEKSFDTYLWQTVARKAAFIYQVMSGKFKGREVDDIGEQALSFAEVKALATGNPLLMEQAGVDQEVARLTRSFRAHNHDQWRLKGVIDGADETLSTLSRVVDQCSAAIERRTETRGDRFSMDVTGGTYTKRNEAGDALMRWLQLGCTRATDDGVTQAIGTLAGLDLTARWTRRRTWGDYYGATTVEVMVRVKGTPIYFTIDRAALTEVDAQGFITRIENAIHGLERERDRALARMGEVNTELARAQARYGLPFPHADELAKHERRAKEIAAVLEAEAQRQERERQHKATENKDLVGAAMADAVAIFTG